MRLYDYPASANCYKVRLLLAQLRIPYERVAVDIFGGDTLTAEFEAKNPQRSTPVLETDDGRFLQESNAILWFLARGTELLPEHAYAQAEVVKWLILEQTDVMPGIGGLRFRLLTGRLRPDEPEAVRRRELGHEALALLDRHLGGRTYVVGERYTIADVSLYGYTHTAPDAGFDLGAYPSVVAWLRQVEAQPRFVEDLEPYPANSRPGAGSSVYG